MREGVWVDRLYLARDLDLNGGVRLGNVNHVGTLGPDESYEASLDFALPTVADGEWLFVIVSDEGGSVYELGRLDNNRGASDAATVRHPDLVPTITASPASVSSAQDVTIDWTTTNDGEVATLSGFVDRVYLSLDETVGTTDRLLGEVEYDDILGADGSVNSSITTTIPVDVRDDWFVLVQTDATLAVIETGNEGNNIVSRPLTCTVCGSRTSNVVLLN